MAEGDALLLLAILHLWGIPTPHRTQTVLLEKLEGVEKEAHALLGAIVVADE